MEHAKGSHRNVQSGSRKEIRGRDGGKRVAGGK